MVGGNGWGGRGEGSAQFGRVLAPGLDIRAQLSEGVDGADERILLVADRGDDVVGLADQPADDLAAPAEGLVGGLDGAGQGLRVDGAAPPTGPGGELPGLALARRLGYPLFILQAPFRLAVDTPGPPHYRNRALQGHR